MRYFLPDIDIDWADLEGWEGFDALASLHASASACCFEDIEIDMSRTQWVQAEMCAAFGAVLYSLGNSPNTIRLLNIAEKVEDVLSRNGFLSHYGRARIPDSRGTTISYRRFDVEDGRHFSAYVEDEFIHRPEMPAMSPGLAKKFQEGIFEIFSNAVLHSATALGIFSCGQFYPKQEKLCLTLADLGVGIRRNVENCTGLHLSSEEAIDWATQENNTTKPRREGVPGGLGLKLLGEFIALNEGCIRIVSDDGYWQKKKSDIFTAKLSRPFPGTVVSLEINTADTRSYGLASEVSVDDIF